MDYFAKKQWIRIAICAVLVAAIVLAMTGVFSGTESLKYDPSAKKLAAGESEAEAAMQGFGGDVTAHLVLEGNTVKELTIDTLDKVLQTASEKMKNGYNRADN